MPVQVKATFKLTGWNANQLRQRVPVILVRYSTILDRQLKEEIKRVVYPWPRETVRYGRLRKAKTVKQSLKIFAEQGYQAGTVVGSPRNIVDSGDFLRSQRVHRNEDGGYSIRFTWDTPYAGLIFTGYTTSKGTLVPGRNWIKPALDAQPLDAFFAAQWRKLASQQI